MAGTVTDGGDPASSPTAADRDEVLRHLSRQLVETDGVLPTLQEVVTAALGVVPCGWAAAAVMDDIGPRPARLAATTDPGVTDCVARISAATGASPGIDASAAAR